MLECLTILPDYSREVFNEHFVNALSLYFATLPAAQLLDVTQGIYQIWENGARQLKDAEASDAPEFVLKAIVKNAARATLAATDLGEIYGVGSDAYRNSISALNQLQEEYSHRVLAAENQSVAISIVREFTAKTSEV
jgi:hypothetical protein